ncbi:tetratricopeptide repeat protein [Aureibaculum sp. 2210JD6-5]|uniref:tetratricopeptide repeat protein n=1 Tax=Aureibaculum sp. 2210JD6-5 TaxID=3103957 RepID=UPI002AACBD8B|nr:tetratricopeptide repeat protein [Aureibaculum sp. 2210JD6-5]MDY7395865.1 tetratricopeptide repeat protein [Aureibaculum sp. 2210JD6-5]
MQKQLFILFLLISIAKTDAQTSVLAVADDYLEKGNYQAALQKLKTENKPTTKVLIKIADIYQKTGNYTNAIQYYNKVYTLKPSDKIKEQLGKCYQYVGNSEKAMELQSEVLKDNPDNLLLQYNLAKLYAANRKIVKAIDLFSGLIEKDPTNPNFHYELGEAYEKIKKDPSKYYLEAYRLDTAHVKSIYQLAKFFNKIKVRDSSKLFIDRGLAINSNNLNFLQLKAQNEFLEKEYDSTLMYLKKLEAQNFKTPFVNKLFGLSYFKLEDYENALLYFNKVVKADFQDTGTLFNIGLVHAAMKEYKKAEMSFYMSIAFQKPDVDKNYFELGKVQLEQNEVKKAIESFQKGFENNPRNYQLLFQIAMLSDGFYKDQKIALKHYVKYVDKFSTYDEKSTLYAKSRIKEIKKELFMKGTDEE